MDIEAATLQLRYAYDKLMVSSKSQENVFPDDIAGIRLTAMLEAAVNIDKALKALGHKKEGQ